MLLDEPTYEAFRAQLRKLGAPVIMPNRLGGALLSAGSTAGVGAGVGAAAGALHSAYKGYQRARAEGSGVIGSVGTGLAGAGSGAMRGAAIGAGAGAIAGGSLSALSQRRAESLRKALTERSALSRFGQRQVHGVTGAVPSEGLSSLRMDASDRLQELKRLKESPTAGAPGWLDKKLGKTESEVATRRIGRAEKAHRAAQEAEDAGMTSLPGVARSVRDRGLLPTMHAGLRTQLYGADPAQKALFVAGTGMTAAGIGLPREGESKVDYAGRVAGGVGSMGLNTLTGGLPAVTQMGVDVASRATASGARSARSRFQRMRKGRDTEHASHSPLHEEGTLGSTMETSPRMTGGE